MRKQKRTNSTKSTELLTLRPLTPIPTLRFTKDPIFVPNTVNRVPNQLQDTKKLNPKLNNEPRKASERDETNDNKMCKNLL
jgi:hypothetical protein